MINNKDIKIGTLATRKFIEGLGTDISINFLYSAMPRTDLTSSSPEVKHSGSIPSDDTSEVYEYISPNATALFTTLEGATDLVQTFDYGGGDAIQTITYSSASLNMSILETYSYDISDKISSITRAVI